MNVQEWFDTLDDETRELIRADAEHVVELSNGLIDMDQALSTSMKAKFKEHNGQAERSCLSGREQYAADGWWHD